MMKQRIDYIDRMKGLAIFLVVVGHVYGFAFNQADALACRMISSFQTERTTFTFACLWYVFYYDLG